MRRRRGCVRRYGKAVHGRIGQRLIGPGIDKPLEQLPRFRRIECLIQDLNLR
jgi:hypothetical protein